MVLVSLDSIRKKKKKRELTIKQVTNLFHVDFQVGDGHSELQIRGSCHDRRENELHNAGDESLQLRVVDVRTLRHEQNLLDSTSLLTTAKGPSLSPAW